MNSCFSKATPLLDGTTRTDVKNGGVKLDNKLMQTNLLIV